MLEPALANDNKTPGGKLPENIAYFARALRAAGLRVGPGHVLDAVQAIEASGIGSKDDLYWTLHAVFVSRHEDSFVFDQAFRLFFRKRAYIERLMQMLMPMTTDRASKPADPASKRVQKALFDGIESSVPPPKKQVIEIDATFTASTDELLKAKDFEQMSVEELAAAKMALRRLALQADEITTRRLKPSSKGKRVDMRRTLRAGLRTGGAFVTLSRRAPIRMEPPIVALLDISGSMSSYSRLMLHFLHALGENGRRVDTFLFGTRLTNVTRQLTRKDPDEALMACARAVPDWQGGTRIAGSLHAFNKLWSRRVLGSRATLLLVTDGLERDDLGLEPEMERLAKSCRRLIWLNPLLRYDGFEAKARGVRAMLPFVDEFRSIHNLRSVETLVAALGKAHARDADPRRWLRAGG